MGKKYNPADFGEQAKMGMNQVALAMDKVFGQSGKLSADFSPLSVSLASYWNNQFAELPMRLQDEADKEHEADEANEADKPKTSPWQHWGSSTKKFFDPEDPKIQRAIDDACRGLWWDLQSPEERIRIVSKWDSRRYPETSVEEFVWMAEKEVKQRKLWVEIKRWEEMNTQGIPSEEKIKNEMLDKLRAELAEIKQRLNSPPAAAAKQDVLDADKNTASKANDEPPGITDGMVTITKLAITAAWEIECETGRKAAAKAVIKRLQEWVTSKKYAELIDVIPHGVKWMTTAPDEKPYDIDACRATLKSWNKSRA